MRTMRCEALILRRTRFSETSLVVSMFTREHGRVDALAKGCLRDKSPFLGHLDMYQREEVLIAERPQAGLDLLIDASFVDEHIGLRFCPAAFAGVGLLAEFSLLTCMPRDPHPELFHTLSTYFALLAGLGEASVRVGCLDGPPTPMADKQALACLMTCRGLHAALSHAGFGLALDRCASCGTAFADGGGWRLGKSAGGLVCPACRDRGDGKVLDEGGLRAVRFLRSGGGYGEISLGDGERRDLLRFLVDYSQYVVEKPLRSAKPLFQLLRQEKRERSFSRGRGAAAKTGL